MKQDILEQIGENWLLMKNSTFTKTNVRYRPSKDSIKDLDVKRRRNYTVTSDIDIVGVHLGEKDEKSVSVISCKSWQHGLHVDGFYHALKNPEADKKRLWKKFRELVEPVWAKAFREKIFEETKSNSFTYYIAVTKITHPESISAWENDKEFLHRRCVTCNAVARG